MQGNTHIAVGVAMAVATVRPKTVGECFAAVIGGAVGGAICDIDLLDQIKRKGVLSSQVIPASITAALLATDYTLQTGLCQQIINADRAVLFRGIGFFIILVLLGIKSSHRSFTHSLLALVLFTAAIEMICPPIAFGFDVGFLSHLLLDLTNKKRLRLLYPCKKGWCLGWCYADGKANTLLLYVGCIASVFFIFNSLIRIQPL